jgi:hypothetical protein
VWSVFGVQSRASRTFVGAPANGLADGRAADPVGDAGGAVATAQWGVGRSLGDGVVMQPGDGTIVGFADGPHAARPIRARTTTKRFMDSISCHETRTPPRGFRDGIETHGPASFAGMSQIRFGGSVAMPHSQRVRAPRRRCSVVVGL